MPPPPKKEATGVTASRASTDELINSVSPSVAVSQMEDVSASQGETLTDASELDTVAQALIGHQLRTLYSEIVREPVPDQLLKLLQDLERKERE